MCFYYLNRLTFVSVSTGLGFCVRGSSIRCNEVVRQYWNFFGGDGNNGESLKFLYTHDGDDFGFGFGSG